MDCQLAFSYEFDAKACSFLNRTSNVFVTELSDGSKDRLHERKIVLTLYDSFV